MKSTNNSQFSLTAARLSIGFAIAFVVLLAALHFLEPEFNLGGHLISEYQLGRVGWLMLLAFFSLGGATLALWFAIKQELQTLGGRIGKWWLLLVATAYFGAGLFYPDNSAGLGLPEDPAAVNRSAVAPTLNATLHGLFGFIIILSSPIVFTLLSKSLARNQRWSSYSRNMRWATVMAWIGLLSLPASLVLYRLFQQPGGFDTRNIVSVVNRFMILTYTAWLFVVARYQMQR